MGSSVEGAFELLPGEVALKKWVATASDWGLLRNGYLYLTNRRLLWVKGALVIFPIRKQIIIDLGEIQDCTPAKFWSSHQIRLRLRDGTKRTFRIRRGVSGEEVASDINSALQERQANHG
jgi:hypothetical protein